MTDEKVAPAAAEWDAIQSELQAAYKLLDTAREREGKTRDHEGKLVDTIRVQADALAEKNKDKSALLRFVEYLVLLVILALTSQLVYITHQLRVLLG